MRGITKMNVYVQDNIFKLNKKFTILQNVIDTDKDKQNRMVEWIGECSDLSILERTMRNFKPERGDIVMCDFGVNCGSEIDKKRPCIVIQTTELNNKLPVTIVVPITTKKAEYETEFQITPTDIEYLTHGQEIYGSGIAIQIRTVSVARLFKKIGKMNDLGLKKVEKSIMGVLGFGEKE